MATSNYGPEFGAFPHRSIDADSARSPDHETADQYVRYDHAILRPNRPDRETGTAATVCHMSESKSRVRNPRGKMGGIARLDVRKSRPGWVSTFRRAHGPLRVRGALVDLGFDTEVGEPWRQ